MNGEDALTLTDHLRELRYRLILSLSATAVASVLAYAVIEPVFSALARPLLDVLPPGSSFVFTSYPEAFFTYMKLSVACGIFLASPVILYHIWAFVAPGLYAHERKVLLLLVFSSSVFFIAGGLFGYFVVFPAAFRFLAGYTGENLKLLPSVSDYVTLILRLFLGFGFAFELPVALTLLGWMGLVDSRAMRRNRKYALLAAFFIGAVLTPTPDILNQTLLALPVYLLYEVSILTVGIVGRRRPKEDLS
ncbi:MAG: twin-arginine translocase subunit TatC [Deltaproteobacteria bacterium]